MQVLYVTNKWKSQLKMLQKASFENCKIQQKLQLIDETLQEEG
jgi:hypothetical protein